jgi:hypothetical protein
MIYRSGAPVAMVMNQARATRRLYGIDDSARMHRHIVERLDGQAAPSSLS